MGGKKTDNHNPQAKLDLRRHFLQKYHADGGADVFDCCQGSGLLWGTLRKEFKIRSYWGVDLKPKPGRLKIDSVRILEQGISQNVIDVDTYDSPWKHWQQIVAHLSQPTTVFLTIGSTMFRGSFDAVGSRALGLDRLSFLPESFGSKISAIAASYALASGCEFATIVEAVEAVSTGHARYLGVRLEPKTI